MQEKLDELRSEIDRLDAELLHLLRKRLLIANEIGLVKRQLGFDITQPQRERDVLEQRKEMARSAGLDEKLVEELFQRIMAASRRVQQ